MNNLFRWITPQFAAAIALFLAIIAPYVVWAAPAMESVGPNGEVLTLYSAPCTHDVIRPLVPPQYRPMLYQGLLRMPDGKEYVNCWVVIGDVVYMQYEDGDQGKIHMRHFKPRPDA